MEEKARVKKKNYKKGSEKNEHACRVEGVFKVSDPTASQYFKLVRLTLTNQILSKLRQFRNWQAENCQKSQTRQKSQTLEWLLQVSKEPLWLLPPCCYGFFWNKVKEDKANSHGHKFGLVCMQTDRESDFAILHTSGEVLNKNNFCLNKQNIIDCEPSIFVCFCGLWIATFPWP